MPTRREVLQGTMAGLAAVVLPAQAQEATGPFDGATAKFDKANQEKLPPWAFTLPLAFSPTIRPRKVAEYKNILGHPVFGPSDPVAVGDVFHGTAREWAETPAAWEEIGCHPTPANMMHQADWIKQAIEAWEDKQMHFGTVLDFRDCPVGMSHKRVYEEANSLPPEKGIRRVRNWGHFPVKCYKIPIVEQTKKLRPDAAAEARLYTYGGFLPGPMLKLRHGQPAVVRFENHLETEVSVHLHGGHTPSHSDGFPSFYVLQGKARDYFYPNIIPLARPKGKPDEVEPDLGESLSTLWYHDHGMDATAYNVSKGLAGMAVFYTDWELKLIRDGVLPGLGAASCIDPDETAPADDAAEAQRRADLEDPAHPGFYLPGKEPFHNPYDLPIVLQDKVIDLRTGQIAYDGDAHNGYLGDTFFANGVPWPCHGVGDRKYRLRLLNGANARVYRLRIISEDAFLRSQNAGLTAEELDQAAKLFLQIGKDSCLWPEALKRTSVVLAMANRVDLVVDFAELLKGAGSGPQAFYLVNTMPQFDGRGPKPKLEDGGDPRVLPLPFDEPALTGDPLEPDFTVPPKRRNLVELNKPIALIKFVITRETSDPAKKPPSASIDIGMPIAPIRPPIPASDVTAVREFIFERGKGAWQVNGRFYDPMIANAAPFLAMVDNKAEEWVLRNGGGGWWHPIHIHLESHQLISYEKDFEADENIDPIDAPPRRRRASRLTDVTSQLPRVEVVGNHDTQILGPNTVVRIRMRFRTWPGPFVFHCHNLEHEDMRMMFNFEPVPGPGHDPNTAPAARTHGNDVTLKGKTETNPGGRVGELEWDERPVPERPVSEAGEELIKPRPAAFGPTGKLAKKKE